MWYVKVTFTSKIVCGVSRGQDSSFVYFHEENPSAMRIYPPELINVLFCDNSWLPYPLHLMILFLASILSNDISVTVHVSDADGMALEKVSVTPSKEDNLMLNSLETDKDGNVKFSLPADKYKFTAYDALGLYDSETTEIIEEFSDTINIKMEPTPNAYITVEFVLSQSPVNQCKGVKV